MITYWAMAKIVKGEQQMVSDLLHLRKSMDWKNDVIPLLGCEYTFTPNIRGMFYNLTYTGVISNTTVYYEGRVTAIAQFNLATQEVAIA